MTFPRNDGAAQRVSRGGQLTWTERRGPHGAHPDGRSAGRAGRAGGGLRHGRGDLVQRQVRLHRRVHCDRSRSHGRARPRRQRCWTIRPNSACSLTTPNAYQGSGRDIPAGTTYARFSLFDDFVDGDDDLDLCVFNSAGTPGLRAAAVRRRTRMPTSSIRRRATTRSSWQGSQTDGPDAKFTLFKWLLGSAAAGNMTVSAPATAATGETGTRTCRGRRYRR